LLHHEGHEEHEELQDQTFDAALQPCDVEIDNQTKREMCQPHVRKDLRLMDWKERFDTFDLHDQLTAYE
jgi:hypothetical protein